MSWLGATWRRNAASSRTASGSLLVPRQLEQRSSLPISQATIAGSSLYATPVKVFTRFASMNA